MNRTYQRKKIFEILQNRKDHPSADDIYREVKKDIPRVSLGTVYRNLEVLAKHKKIQIHFSGQKRFDSNPEPHHHFYCVGCGKMEDLPFSYFHSPLTYFEGHKDWFNGRRIDMATITVQGLCPRCVKGNNQEGE
jgi:Fe2+ or Zn2+ uptake regulation protein